MTPLRQKFSFANDPGFLRKFHLVMTIFWACVALPVAFTSLRNSVALIVFVSIYANFISHWSTLQGLRVEMKQDAA